MNGAGFPFQSITADSTLGAAASAAATATDVDPQRLAIQQDLRRTQFYKGRADGKTGDEDAMTAAIKLVQINASLPVTGVYDPAVHHAIDNYVRTAPTGNPQWTDPPPAPVTAPSPIAVPPPSRTSPTALATLLGISLLTSPIWIALLVLPAWKRNHAPSRGASRQAESARSARGHGGARSARKA